MSGPILTPDEIDALLHVSTDESPHKVLTEVLGFVAENTGQHLRRFASGTISIDGPYVESLERTLDQVVGDDSYVLPVDLGSSQLFVFVTKTDGAGLGWELSLSPEQSVQTVGHVWMEALAMALSEFRGTKIPFRLFRTKILPQSSLAQLPIEDDTLFIRHLLQWNKTELEFNLLLPGGQTQELLQQKKRTEQIGEVERTQPTQSSRRLLKPTKSPVTEAAFVPLEEPRQFTNSHSLSLVEDIDLPVTVELGHAVMTLGELLELQPQTVISLDRHAGESVDVFINDNPTAKGEVLVLDEHFGVRVLEILPKSERIPTD